MAKKNISPPKTNVTKAKIVKKEDNTLAKQSIAQALYKKAVGYSLDEIVEEYQVDEGSEVKLVKRKVTTKQVPPDTSAVKTLLEYFYQEAMPELKNLTDEELEKEKQRLLRLIKEYEED